MVLLGFKLPASSMEVKLNRAHSLGQGYNSSFLPECLLKINGKNSFINSLIHSNSEDRLSIRVNSEFAGSEYILFLNLFNAFFELGPKESFFTFKTDTFSSTNSAIRLLGSIKLGFTKKVQFLNFTYFTLFFYLPRLSSLGSAPQPFSNSVVFPDFSRYVHHFANFNRKYPHYSGVLRKLGLLVFLDDYNISYSLAVSSYIFKSAYVSMGQNEDWSLKFKVYFGSSLSVDYFKLQKSFLKFFVVGKSFLA